MKPKVLLVSRIPDDDAARIGEWADVVRIEPYPPSRDALQESLRDADGVLFPTSLRFDADLLAGAPKLKTISVVGVGFDNVDVEAAAARGVAVAHTPGVLTDTVAELTMALMLALVRRLPEAMDAVRTGRWRETPLGVDLRSRTLLIVGFGRIGRAVAERALAFGMHVVAHDARTVPAFTGVSFASDFHEALGSADVVSLHVDLNSSSRALVGAEELEAMKPTAYLVNTSRGGVVDQEALYEALSSGRIAGAALDVLEIEPAPPDHPLLSLRNVIVVPHIGSATAQTRRAILELAIDNLRACVLGEPCECLVRVGAPG